MSNKPDEIHELETVTDAERNHQTALEIIRARAANDPETLKAAAIAEHAITFLSAELRDSDRLTAAAAQREAREERRERTSLAKLKAAETARSETAAIAIRALAKLLPKALQQARNGKPALLRMILRATR